MPKVNKIIQRLINQERIQLNENTEIKPLISTSPPLSPPPPPPSSTRNSQVQRQKSVISRQQPYVSEPSRVSLNPLIKHDSNVQLFSSSSASSLKGNNDHDELFPFINFNEFEFSHRGTILNSRTRSSRRNHLRDTNNREANPYYSQQQQQQQQQQYHNNHHQQHHRFHHQQHPLPVAHHQNQQPNTNNNSSTSSTVIQRTNDNLSIVSSSLGIEDNFYLNIISDDASFQPHINTIFQNNSVGTSGTMINPNGVPNGSIRTASSTKNTTGRKLVQKLYASLDYTSDHVLIEEEEEEDDDYNVDYDDEDKYHEVDEEEEEQQHNQIHLKIRQSLERQMLTEDTLYGGGGGGGGRNMKKISRINDNDEEVTIQEVTSINSQLSNLEIPFINASQTPLLPPPQSLPTNFPGSSSLHQPISTATILPPTSSSYRTNLASTCASTGTGTATATSTMASSTTKHCINTVLNFVKKR